MNVRIEPETGHYFLSPLGFVRYAEHFLKAAKSSLPEVGDPFSPVPYYLLCHAIELLLKAFIMANGETLEYVKSKLGHDLPKALKKANDLGLAKIVPLSQDDIEAVDKAHEYYNVKTKGFEYFRIAAVVHGYGDLPSLPVLEGIAERLLTEVRPVCIDCANA